MTIRQTLRSALLLALAATLLPGCFVYLDDRDDDPEPPPPVNSFPEIIEEETFWTCEYSESADDYWFEFQTVVEDGDGPRDVEYVDVTVFDANTEYEVDSFGLLYEDDGMWGGIVWETESDLFEWCGRPIDVRFDAWDYAGDHDAFTLYYD